jgi:hypothetical protein
LLEEQQAAYLVGAVLPDTLLHLIHTPTALALGSAFHEPSGSSYAPLIRFLEGQGRDTGQTPDRFLSLAPCPLTLDPAVTACLLGVASHIEADIVFHPYICALAGDHIGRHYQLETELDLYLLSEGKRPAVWRLDELLTREVSEQAVMVLRGVFDPEGRLPDKALQHALQLHGQIQGMYGTPPWQLLAWLLGRVPNHRLRSYQKLFYPFGWQRGRPKAWPDQWRHPVTGQERGDTPDGLMVDACNRITELLRRVGEQGMVQSFKNHPGENLITGLTALPAHTPTITVAAAPS